MLRWGTQLDIEPVFVSTELEGISDQRVAAYILARQRIATARRIAKERERHEAGQ
ncbi:hypothetical protein [Streptosporangium sp. CA-115845]|uniref:hypothetical protein n=1 Tax=Streptosporangium sp. CA-115845 TaxID=3240071 RepID=UPI003D916DC7